MLKLGARTGSLAARLLSSAALLLTSVAYAAWPQKQESPSPGNNPINIRVEASASRRILAPAPHGGGEAQPAELPAAPSVTKAQPVPSVHAPVTAHDDSLERAPSLPKADETSLPRDDAANSPPLPALDTATTAPTPPPPMQYALAAPAAAGPRQHPHYGDGDFTGEPVDCYWGIVQVKVQIKSGAIAEVDFLQMPDHRRRSAEISNWVAAPLAQEAIQEQTAEVDIVSSATNTTSAFQQSLKTALDKALK